MCMRCGDSGPLCNVCSAEIIAICAQLCDLEEGLSQWEADFVDEMYDNTTFTEKQWRKLDEIAHDRI
jgi:hypothetical protein